MNPDAISTKSQNETVVVEQKVAHIGLDSICLILESMEDVASHFNGSSKGECWIHTV